MKIRIIIWLLFIALAVFLIGPNFQGGYTVERSGVDGISSGLTLFSINGESPEEALLKQYNEVVKFETNEGSKFQRITGMINITAERAKLTKLNFGLDIKGGIMVMVEPQTGNMSPAERAEVIQQTVSTLETRINTFGLREASFRPIDNRFVEISLAGGTEEELRTLLENEGVFEAKIPLDGAIQNELTLRTKHAVSGEEGITIDGTHYSEGETAVIDGTSLEVGSGRRNVTAVVFSGTDITNVGFDSLRSNIERTNTGYQWGFGIDISGNGAERFSQVTSNLQPKGESLNKPIILYLDGEIIDELSISSTLRGRTETSVQISGGADTKDEAIKERSRMQSILRSGALPAPIQIIEFNSISANLGEGFLRNAIMAALGAMIVVSAIVFARYRKLKIVLPLIAVSFSEVLIIVGLATGIGWTIDLASIAGIIAAVGTGVDSQIIIIDQATKRASEISLKERLKRSFFIIFGAGGTTISAMIPMLIFGLGILKGFALVTILGVLIGILIARPAFGEIVKMVQKDE